MRILFLLPLLLYIVIYAVNIDSLPSYFDDDDDDEDTSHAQFDDFMKRFGKDYGYDGTIDNIRENDMKRLKGAVYMDYTGSGVYRESQIKKCSDLLMGDLFGNAHSRNPSSLNTEHEVEFMRERVLQFFNASPMEYSVIFTSGATGALHIVGESFPWSKDSSFYYLSENHNSVLGIREYALRFGSGFRAVNEEDLPNESVYEFPIKDEEKHGQENQSYSLFAFPAEDNFAGVKYPLSWIKKVQDGFFRDGRKWLVILDAAAFVPTNKLDMSVYKPDFVSLSFYKMFGFPTGLGALLLRNEHISILNKRYWGGGTVSLASEKDHFCVFHGRPCSRFEDGTINFLSIACLRYGFESLESLGINRINRHVTSITRYLYEQLDSIRHSNGNHVVEIYGKHSENNSEVQGGIVVFNIRRNDGTYVGYYQIQTESAVKNIHVRTGCHCNPGACRKYMNQPEQVFEILSMEKVSCSDAMDQYNGIPLGGVRASVGYLTTFNDVMTLVGFIKGYVDVYNVYSKKQNINS